MAALVRIQAQPPCGEDPGKVAVGHNQDVVQAGFEHPGHDLVGPRGDVWEKVIVKIRSGAMPPLGQPRPEYGHCTNAMAVVGRRTLTRGLHLDRRPFLISYDPAISADGRRVAFSSTARNLVPGDTTFSEDVFVRSLVP